MFSDRFDVLISKIIFKKYKKKLYFNTFLNRMYSLNRYRYYNLILIEKEQHKMGIYIVDMNSWHVFTS
jgi:hypothetical protein